MANPNFSELSGMPVYNPKDLYNIANALVKQVTGQTPAIQAVDTSSFISVGQMCLNTSLESTIRALSEMIGKTFVAIRPYTGKFTSIEQDSMQWGMIVRKISFFATQFDQSTDWNTDLAPNQLVDGASVDMYKIKKTYPMQLFFNGFTTLQKDYTRFENQLKVAFESEAAFSAYLYCMSVEIENDIATWKESKNRLMAANLAGALLQDGQPESRVNLTAAFNAKYGTTYTSEELRTSKLSEFLSFFVAWLETESQLMTENTTMYHLTPKATDDKGNALMLLRHTPKAMQKLLLYTPLITEAKAWVLPRIFGPGYLSLDNYEGVNFWQNIKDKAKIVVKPSSFDVDTAKQKTGKEVTIPYVVGLLYDRDCMATRYVQEGVYTTPFNTHGRYWNVTHHWAEHFHMDMTENAILLYMADPADDPAVDHSATGK